MKIKEFTGKTTKEAIDNGLAELGVTIADVHVDVLQEGVDLSQGLSVLRLPMQVVAPGFIVPSFDHASSSIGSWTVPPLRSMRSFALIKRSWFAWL